MSKTKSKEVAASDVPSGLEETNGNVAKSAPPMLINTREETTMVVDRAEEDVKEESKENEIVDSVETDVPEGEEVDEGDKTKEVKATEEVKGDEKGKSTSKKKGKVLRKRKMKAVINAASGVPSGLGKTTGNVAESAQPMLINTREETTMVVDTAEGDAKEESKENKKAEKVDSIRTDVPEGEKVNEGDKGEEVKATGDEKGKSTSKKKGKVLRKRKTKAVINAAASSEKKEASASAAASIEKTKEASAIAGVSDEKPKEKPNGTDQPETPKTPTADTKKLKMADGMGLIFMCNAKTKNDCFHYKVLGLPASKKEMVEKIYKGMRLFLFDVDLKLMYGIYEAASPGGYNLEPKAFKSAFPSQVRFSVLDDCLPLPEEKFKAVIKENYYGRNKFNCQLSVEQQRNLCKLFKHAGKAPSSSKKSREAIRAEPGPRSADQGRKRWSRAEAEPTYTDRDRKRRSRAEPDPSSADRDLKRRPLHERERVNRIPPRIRGRDFYSRREAYASPPTRPVAYGSQPRMVAPLQPPPPPSYGYDRLVDYYYRREPLPSAELRDHGIMNVVETRAREPIEHRNPYALYREPHPYREAPYAPASLPSMSYAPHSYPPY